VIHAEPNAIFHLEIKANKRKTANPISPAVAKSGAAAINRNPITKDNNGAVLIYLQDPKTHAMPFVTEGRRV
jgi:hypothetical protein